MKLPEEFKKLFERDLLRLRDELDKYEDEERLWEKSGVIKNSAGNLIMHICGNLRHFIGATLNNDGYERNRPFEFEGKLPKDELLIWIDDTKKALVSYFERVSEADMYDPYPEQPFGYPMTKSQFLIHLYGHLNYHLGQINYHRRLLTKD